MSDVVCPRVGRLSRVGLFRSNPSNRGVHIVRKTELGQHVSIQGRLWTCGSGLHVQGACRCAVQKTGEIVPCRSDRVKHERIPFLFLSDFGIGTVLSLEDVTAGGRPFTGKFNPFGVNRALI